MIDDANGPASCHGYGCGGDGCGFGAGRTLPAPDAVAASLPLLERPAAVTENSTLRITQIAAYAPPMGLGSPLTVPPGEIALRLDRRRLAGATLDDGDTATGQAPALRLVGHGGELVHSCHPLSDVDRLTLDGFARRGGVARDRSQKWPPFTRDRDDEVDQVARLDEIVAAAGGSLPPLPHAHVDLAVVPELFAHLGSVGLPVGLAVVAPGLAHLLLAPWDNVVEAGERVVVAASETIVEIIPARIAHCLVVRTHAAHGPTFALELFDSSARCVAVLAPWGLVPAREYRAWQDLAASLPALEH